MEGSYPNQIDRYHDGAWERTESEVIVESPVSLMVNGDLWLTFRCTPIDLEALAAGFLFNEGVIREKEEIASVHVCEHRDMIDVWINHPTEKPANWQRTSGCTGGVTALESIYNLTPVDTFIREEVISPEPVSYTHLTLPTSDLV